MTEQGRHEKCPDDRRQPDGRSIRERTKGDWWVSHRSPVVLMELSSRERVAQIGDGGATLVGDPGEDRGKHQREGRHRGQAGEKSL